MQYTSFRCYSIFPNGGEGVSELVNRGLVKIVIVHSSSKVDFYNYYYEVVKFRDPNPPVPSADFSHGSGCRPVPCALS